MTLDASNRRPNIIVVLTDDQGLGQAPCFADDLTVHDCIANPTPRYRCDPERALAAAREAMPNLRAVAGDGVVCTDAHVTSPVCGPSRCSLLTGRYNQRFGVYSNGNSGQGLPVSEVCLAVALQAAGYRTAAIGKWHVGGSTHHQVESESRDYHRSAAPAATPPQPGAPCSGPAPTASTGARRTSRSGRSTGSGSRSRATIPRRRRPPARRPRPPGPCAGTTGSSSTAPIPVGISSCASGTQPNTLPSTLPSSAI